MRVLIYGAASVAALAACAEMARAASVRPVWRNDRFFKPDETEPATGVVCLEGAVQAPAIAEAYAARKVPVFAVPAERETFEASETVRAYAELLGLKLDDDGQSSAGGGDGAIPPNATVISHADPDHPVVVQRGDAITDEQLRAYLAGEPIPEAEQDPALTEGTAQPSDEAQTPPSPAGPDAGTPSAPPSSPADPVSSSPTTPSAARPGQRRGGRGVRG